MENRPGWTRVNHRWWEDLYILASRDVTIAAGKLEHCDALWSWEVWDCSVGTLGHGLGSSLEEAQRQAELYAETGAHVALCEECWTRHDPGESPLCPK